MNVSVIVIGGHSRMHQQYIEICARRGYKAKVYTHKTPQFDKVIGKPHGIILFTNPVSHSMVQTVVKEAKRKNIPLVRCHNSSVHSLEQSLDSLVTC